MELTFFEVPCFGFVAKTVDNTPVFWLLLSSACSASSLFLSPSPSLPSQQVGHGWAGCWEGMQPGQLSQTDQSLA